MTAQTVPQMLRELADQVEKRISGATPPSQDQLRWAIEQLGSHFKGFQISIEYRQWDFVPEPELHCKIYLPATKQRFENLPLPELVRQAIGSIVPPKADEAVAAILPAGVGVDASGEPIPF